MLFKRFKPIYSFSNDISICNYYNHKSSLCPPKEVVDTKALILKIFPKGILTLNKLSFASDKPQIGLRISEFSLALLFVWDFDHDN